MEQDRMDPGMRATTSLARPMVALVMLLSPATAALVVPLSAARPATSLVGSAHPRVSDGAVVDLGDVASSSTDGDRSLIIFGTYPADFNMIEYAQRLRHSIPQLREKRVERFVVVVNGEPSACTKLASFLSLPPEVELLSDPSGEAGRRFGVSRGWRPDDAGLNPYLKLYLMLFGIGYP